MIITVIKIDVLPIQHVSIKRLWNEQVIFSRAK